MIRIAAAIVLYIALTLSALAQFIAFPGPGMPTGGVKPSITFQALTSDVSNSTVYTYSGAALGTADPTRKILVCVMGSNAGLAAPTVTVAGSTATVQASIVGAANATTALYSVALASGTTGNIVVTWSAGQVRTSIAVWATYNLTSGTVVNSASSAVATASLNVNLTAGDIMAVCGESGTSTSATATGYTQRFNVQDSELEAYNGGDFTASITEAPRTVTMTWNGSTVFASLAATFR